LRPTAQASPLAGILVLLETIQFTIGGQRPVTVQTSSAGTFLVKLPAGTYGVSGRSPRVIEVSGGTSR
jgi:hypothetical protein